MEVVKKSLTDEAFSLLFAETGNKKRLLERNIRIIITSKVIPPKKTISVPLPHIPSDMSVAIIVKDLFKTDHDKSAIVWKEKWEDEVGKTKNAPKVTFIPLHELKCAYQSYESKRKLASTFDIFLADRRIMHYLPNKLGKAFYHSNRSKIPIGVSINEHNMLQNVIRATQSCQIHIQGNGTSESVVIGNTSINKESLKLNALSVINGAFNSWPGGLANIRNVSMQAVGGVCIPIYSDLTDAPVHQLVESLNEIAACNKKANIEEAKLPRPGKRKIIERTAGKSLNYLTVRMQNRLKQLQNNLEDNALGSKKIRLNESSTLDCESLLKQVTEDLPISKAKLSSILGPKQRRVRKAKKGSNKLKNIVQKKIDHEKIGKNIKKQNKDSSNKRSTSVKVF